MFGGAADRHRNVLLVFILTSVLVVGIIRRSDWAAPTLHDAWPANDTILEVAMILCARRAHVIDGSTVKPIIDAINDGRYGSTIHVYRFVTVSQYMKYNHRKQPLGHKSPAPESSVPLCSTQQRLAHIRAVCAREGLSKRKVSGLLVDHKRKMVYCEIPKIASTTWRTIMVNATGRCPLITPDMDMKHRLDSQGYMRCSGLTRETYTRALERYTKYVVLRHPLDRLLSAYHDKAFIHRTRDDRVVIYKKYKSIVQYSMKKLTSSSSQGAMKSHVVPFEHFVEYILEKDDKHWRSYAEKCGVCHIDYDYIMRTESLEADSGYFLHQFYPSTSMLPSFNHLQDGDVSQHVRQRTLNEFQSIDEHLMRRVRKMYRLDFELFGYDFDSKSNIASCAVGVKNGSTCC